MADAGTETAAEVLRHPALTGTAHGFLGRRGGTAGGAHDGLNVGFGGDDPREHVLANRALAVEAVQPGATLATVFQIHSAEVVSVSSAWSDEERPRADALVTDRPGLLLGILTADCAPVLLHDPVAQVIGAAHAGWRGACGGVTDATIAAMERLGAQRSRMAAVVGPCIHQPSYEVDGGFRVTLLDADPANERFFVGGRTGHHQFDLPGYVVARLMAAGVGAVAALDEDTYGQPDRFFSFRRATHRGEANYGRQISLIGLG